MRTQTHPLIPHWLGLHHKSPSGVDIPKCPSCFYPTIIIEKNVIKEYLEDFNLYNHLSLTLFCAHVVEVHVFVLYIILEWIPQHIAD